MDIIEFWTICSANGIVLSKEQLDKIERYVNELMYWNEKVNLISRKDYSKIFENHILHSLALIKYYEIPKKARVLDVGTGGGLPGLPLKIARPDIFITLVDSIKKKTKIVEMFAKHTGEKNINVVNSRVEELYNIKDFKNNFDLVVTRAVASISNVLAWSKKIRKQTSGLVFYKGGDISAEISQAKMENKNLDVTVVNIDLVGIESFKKNDKKLIICKFN